MRLIFLAVFLIVNLLGAKHCNAQGPGTFQWTNGAPNNNPGLSGAKFAVDKNTYRWYEWVSGTTWVQGGDRIQQISGCAAPAYTPTIHNAYFVVNGCTEPEFYYWNGTAWKLLNGGATYTAGSGIAISGGNVISNTAPNINQTISLSGQNLTLSNGGGTVSLPAGGIYGGSGNIAPNAVAVQSTAGNFTLDTGPSTANGNTLVIGDINDVNGAGSPTVLSFISSGFSLGNDFARFSFNGVDGEVSLGTQGVYDLYASFGRQTYVNEGQLLEIVDNRNNAVGIQYNGDYSTTLKSSENSLPDVKTVNLLKKTPVVWTTGTRPTPAGGEYPWGFNTTTGKHEGWNGSTWNAFY